MFVARVASNAIDALDRKKALTVAQCGAMWRNVAQCGAAESWALLAIKRHSKKSTPGPLPAGPGSCIIHHNCGGSAVEGLGVCVFRKSDGCLCTDPGALLKDPGAL